MKGSRKEDFENVDISEIETMKKKQISSRSTKNKSYILYAPGSELLVVENSLAKFIIDSNMEDLYKNKEIFNILRENLFFEDIDNIAVHLPKEKTTLFWKNLRILLFSVFLISLITILRSLKVATIPRSYDLIKMDTNILIVLVISILFSILTTIFHELMHLIYSNNINNIRNVFKVSLKKSVAYVNITHVWIWSMSSRLAAVSAGVILDFVWLSCLLAILNSYNNELISILAMVIFFRIIWQLRFHKNSDGKYFAMMLLDNPLIDIDYSEHKDQLRSVELIIWRTITWIGYLIDLYILICWIVPGIYYFLRIRW